MARANTIVDGAAEMADAIIADPRYTRDDAEGFSKRFIYKDRGEVAFTVDVDRGTVTYFAFGTRNTIKIGKRHVKRIVASIPVRDYSIR